MEKYNLQKRDYSLCAAGETVFIFNRMSFDLIEIALYTDPTQQPREHICKAKLFV